MFRLIHILISSLNKFRFVAQVATLGNIFFYWHNQIINIIGLICIMIYGDLAHVVAVLIYQFIQTIYHGKLYYFVTVLHRRCASTWIYLMCSLMGLLVAQVNRGSRALGTVTVSVQTGIQACTRITPNIRTIY